MVVVAVVGVAVALTPFKDWEEVVDDILATFATSEISKGCVGNLISPWAPFKAPPPPMLLLEHFVIAPFETAMLAAAAAAAAAVTSVMAAA